VLGDHAMADELRSLGLPKRALFSSSAAVMTASFGAARVVGVGEVRPPADPIETVRPQAAAQIDPARSHP
jgi:hypothetical protein